MNCSHMGQSGQGDASLYPTPSLSGVGNSNRQAPKAEVLILGSMDHLTEVGRLLQFCVYVPMAASAFF